MPYKHTEKLIPTKLKRSAKLTPDQKEEMRKMYNMGGWSYSKLGAEFGVSKSTAIYAVNPERQKHNYALRVARGGSKQYYNKEKSTIATREHRQYKQELYLKGELVDDIKTKKEIK